MLEFFGIIFIVFGGIALLSGIFYILSCITDASWYGLRIYDIIRNIKSDIEFMREIIEREDIKKRYEETSLKQHKDQK